MDNTELVLKKAIVNLVVPNGDIEDDSPYHVTISTSTISTEQVKMLAKILGVGIDITMSVWPVGVVKPNLEERYKTHRMVIRFSWCPSVDGET